MFRLRSTGVLSCAKIFAESRRCLCYSCNLRSEVEQTITLGIEAGSQPRHLC
jgi:hypothetical protein